MAFRMSTGFGIVVLVIGDPLYIIIVMAFWRLVLEAFVVVFRIAEDVRAHARARRPLTRPWFTRRHPRAQRRAFIRRGCCVHVALWAYQR